jgi:hypothetical protein
VNLILISWNVVYTVSENLLTVNQSTSKQQNIKLIRKTVNSSTLRKQLILRIYWLIETTIIMNFLLCKRYFYTPWTSKNKYYTVIDYKNKTRICNYKIFILPDIAYRISKTKFVFHLQNTEKQTPVTYGKMTWTKFTLWTNRANEEESSVLNITLLVV